MSSPKCPTVMGAERVCGADGRGTHPRYDHMSHTHPNENTLYRGLMWDTLAKHYAGAMVLGRSEYASEMARRATVCGANYKNGTRTDGFGSRRRYTKKDPMSGLFVVAPTGIEPVCQD